MSDPPPPRVLKAPGDRSGAAPAPLVTLFESVQSIIEGQSFRYWQDGRAEPHRFPLHVMLFDPADGCFHAFLNRERASEPKEKDVLEIAQLLRTHRENLPIEAMLDWVGRSLSNDSQPGLLKELLAGDRSLPEAMAHPPTAKTVLCALLSALPSRFDWDVCGYYHKDWHEHSGRTVWSYDGESSEITCRTLGGSARAESGAGAADATYQTFRELVAAEYPGETRPFGGDSKDRQWPYMPSGNPAYDAYSAIYESLRKLLFPESEFNWMYYEPLTASQLCVGVVFVDLSCPLDSSHITFDRRIFEHSASLFRLEKHRDLWPAIERVRMLAFDDQIYQKMHHARSFVDIARLTGRHLNHLFPVESCSIELPVDLQGSFRPIAFHWHDTEDGTTRRFDESQLHDRALHADDVREMAVDLIDPLPMTGATTLCLRACTRETKSGLEIDAGSYLKAFQLQRELLVKMKVQGLASKLLEAIEARKRQAEGVVEEELQHSIRNVFDGLRRNHNEMWRAVAAACPGARRRRDPFVRHSAQMATLQVVAKYLHLRELKPRRGAPEAPPISLAWRPLLEMAYLHAALHCGKWEELLGSYVNWQVLCEQLNSHVQLWDPQDSQWPELTPELRGLLRNDPDASRDFGITVTSSLENDRHWSPQEIGLLYMVLVEIARNGFRHETPKLGMRESEGWLILVSTNAPCEAPSGVSWSADDEQGTGLKSISQLLAAADYQHECRSYDAQYVWYRHRIRRREEPDEYLPVLDR